MPKKTPLSEIHESLGATMVDFAGWYMPVQYTNVIEEHSATRQKAGLFDICHMGEFEVSGKNAFIFLQKVLTNDISTLQDNFSRYALMCNDNGGVVDDLFVYKLGNKYMLVVNASNIEKDLSWLRKHNSEGVALRDISSETAKLDIQGPYSEKTLQKLTASDLSGLSRFCCRNIILNGTETLISRTGYTAEDGFEIYFSSEKAVDVWNAILDAGAEFGIRPVGLGARDTLRQEACYSLYGHELDEDTTPYEAGIGFAVKLNKDFIGKAALKRQVEYGTRKALVCFEMVERAVPREHYKVFDNDTEIGIVSSGTFSPTFKKGLGMAYVKPGIKDINKIDIEIRGKRYKALTVRRPFYSYAGKGYHNSKTI